jgi:GWxTD domain-containing protein
MCGLRLWVAGLCIVLLGTALPVDAQPSTASDTDIQLAFADGVQAVRGGNEGEAASLLERVFTDTPSYYDTEKGSAAYWLGRAYEEDEQTGRAISTWRVGLITLNASDRFEVQLADAFVRRVFREQDTENYALASAAYLRLMKGVGDASLTAEQRDALVPHLRHLALVMPDDAKRHANLPSDPGAITAEAVASVDGEALLAWWRGEDPLPATEKNERVREHLRRVAHARKHYASGEAPSGFDDRGRVYVRLGEPDDRVTIRYNDTRLTDLLFQPGVTVNLSDLPENEFWSYGRSTDRSTYYIFVQPTKGAPWKIGDVQDLLPRQLRSGFTSTQRGQQRSVMALAMLRAIYRKYSDFHPELAHRHDEVANYMADAVDEGSMMDWESLSRQQYRPYVFAQRTMSETQNKDAQAQYRRQKFTPQHTSAVLDEHGPLDVAARTARFLNDDGTTRTEVYWTPTPEALVPTQDDKKRIKEASARVVPNDYVVRLTASQKAPDYQTRIVNQKHYRLTDVGGGDRTIPARTFTTQLGDSTMYHLSLQWDQFAVADRGGQAGIGPKLKVGTVRRDSLRALTSDERLLEMSDLRPMVVPETASGAYTESAIPYPFQTVTPETPLMLYFEVYHLPYGGDDRTRYTVEYEVQRRTDRGALVDLFRSDGEESTTVTTTNDGTSRTAKEYIMLDLAEWEVDTNSDVTVNVRVTDERSGQTVERSVDFELQPAE